MIEIQVHMFAVLRDAIGVKEDSVSLPDGATGADLLHALVERYPPLHPWRNIIRLAVNETYVANTAVLHHGDTVACIPPVSGG